MNETVLLLARHAATASNLRRPYILQGQGVDHDLDPLGWKQATALAEALANESLAAIYCSPLKRASQTAELVAKKHDMTPTVVNEITEANAGVWEGKSWDEITVDWPDERAAHDDDPGENGYPGGETFVDVCNRSEAAVQSIVQRHHGETILVVAHNVVNRSMLARWLGVPIKYSRRIPQNNAAYNVVLWPDGVAKVRSINLARHLSGLIPPD